MSDYELLCAAAHAAGYEVARVADDGKAVMLVGQQEPWNPLDDDGDALRLAVRRRLSIHPSEHSVAAIDWADRYRVMNAEPYGSDAAAATRRAIVRNARGHA